MSHALRFDADLPHQIGGCEMRQEKGGDEYRTNHGLGAIQREISGGPDQGEQGGKDAFERKLQQLNCADAGRADAEGYQFRPDGNPAVAEQSVAEGHIHGVVVCIILSKEQIFGLLH
jgi:hypothetical protein